MTHQMTVLPPKPAKNLCPHPNMDNLPIVNDVDVVHLHLQHEPRLPRRGAFASQDAPPSILSIYTPPRHGTTTRAPTSSRVSPTSSTELLITRFDDVWYKSCSNTAQWSRTLLRFPCLQRLAVTPLPFGFRGLVGQTPILEALAAREHGVDLCPALKHFAIVSPEKLADAAVLQQTAACLQARLERGLRLSRLSVDLRVSES